MTSDRTTWTDANQRYLLAALVEGRAALERHVARASGTGGAVDQPRSGGAEASLGARETAEGLEGRRARFPVCDLEPPALQMLCAAFGLSDFERGVLLLCAGMELDSAFPALCAAAQGDPTRPYPTFSLALAVLPEPHWSALVPTAPLRRWRLIEVGAGSGLVHSPLRIDERVLHYLTGLQHVDERLAGLVESVPWKGDLVPSHRVVAQRIVAAWSQPGIVTLPVIQLCGEEAADKVAIAAAAGESLGLHFNAISVHAIPTAPAELNALMQLWEREAVLGGSALLVKCDEIDPADQVRAQAVAQVIERMSGPLIIACRELRRTRQRPMITFDVCRPTAGEQWTLWQGILGSVVRDLNGSLDTLISQFRLSPQSIRTAAFGAMADLTARSAPSEASPKRLERLLWDACRIEARPRLDRLAQRIDPAATWEDLVLTQPQLELLREITAHVRHRAKVYEAWGFAGKESRGLGITALFAGASGTGKTMAAEVLAHELRLDLYRIDLSQVVSKYIGETEKNLRHVFDTAEGSGAILLFDEADALFGKRSEVKDSHDRYANIEVGYLLQRMEAYRGLAILTTNMKEALDQGFLRRIRFIVHFPFPGAAQRAEIWRRIFPSQTPTEGLDATRLARLNVTGGTIRNIALAAAFRAAGAGELVRMTHLLQAARIECAKLERPLTEAEIGEWV